MILGYVAKATFRDLDEKSFVTLSVYFLQPILTFWGLSKAPITFELADVSALYLMMIVGMCGLFWGMARAMFNNPKERSIVTVAALIGNTGNIGIPLGLAIFGEASLLYTTAINLMNVVFVYTFGVFFYARGSYSVRDALLAILKLPVLWLATLAIVLNLGGIHYPDPIEKGLEMGAHASMVIQLIIFGIYLYSVSIKEMSFKLNGVIILQKFLLVPFVGWEILQMVSFPATIEGVVLLELIVPLAVANVNLASLYDCRPVSVTASVFVTSLVFIVLLPIYILLFGWGGCL